MDHHGANGPSVPGRWWGPTAASVSNADVMNQLCRVCGEPAAGFHFGAFTCEGCKSFFGRTYNNLSSVSECKNNGACIINKKNRTSCKACRLRKCLRVGMSKSGSRYGRRSNWFKIHCLLQEQQQHHTQISSSNVPPKPPWLYGAKDSATLLDVDNNNSTLYTDPKMNSSAFLQLPSSGMPKSPDSNSPFWTSRHNYLSVPSPHSLAPYFVSPFFQNTLHPLPASNYLLPFLPSRPSLPLEPLAASPTSSSTHSTSPSAATPPAKKEEETTAGIGFNRLEKLKSLGPVQDQPIDLSSANKSYSNSNSNCSTGGAGKRRDSRKSSCSDTEDKIDSIQFEQNVESKRDENTKILNPLDLSRLTS